MRLERPTRWASMLALLGVVLALLLGAVNVEVTAVRAPWNADVTRSVLVFGGSDQAANPLKPRTIVCMLKEPLSTGTRNVVSRYRTGGGRGAASSSCQNAEATRTAASSSTNWRALPRRASRPRARSGVRTGMASSPLAIDRSSSASPIRFSRMAARGPISSAQGAAAGKRSSGSSRTRRAA
jgi:hypothetical protein